jgi:hypothetical protein
MDQQFKKSTLKRKEQNEVSEIGVSSETLQHQQNKNKSWKYSNSYLKMGFMRTTENHCVQFVMGCPQMKA